ncbi:MAG: response regulator [Deltaproteobacteria bacterium]|nr:response regulator [Deltaproteobacteria bacterium]
MKGKPMPATILIIDDDPGIRESLAAFLEDYDYRVITAENGRTGLLALETMRPDLALVDLSMPEVDGFEVLASASKKALDIPLIVVSGTGRISDTVKALHLGAWDYILKPIETMSIVLHAIEKSLDSVRLKRENRQYQMHLEELVRERTAELEQSKNQLIFLNLRLRRLVDTTAGLSDFSDVESFGQNLLEEFARNMAATGGSIFFIEKDGLVLLHSLDSGHAPEKIPFPLPEQSILKRLLDERKPLLIENVTQFSDLGSSGWNGYADESTLAFPLLDDDNNPIALLTLHNRAKPPFVQQDKEIGTILASYSREVLRAIRNYKALQDSEKRFRELADLLPQFVCELDTAGRVIYANQNAFKVFGYTEDDLAKGISIYDLIAPQDHAVLEADMSKAMISKSRKGKEYLARKRDGRTLPVIAYSSSILKDNQSAGLRIIVIDITDRKASEAEREKLIRAIQYVNDVVVITNTEGVIEYANRAFEVVTGYSLEEAIGKNPRILKSGKHDAAFYKNLWSTISQGQVWEGRVINKRKNGTLYTDETTISPVFDPNGNIVQYVSVKRDITQELKLEAQLRQAQKMEALGVLAGGIAHDFNNLLMGILGFSDLALMRIDDQPEKAKKSLERVLEAGNRAKNMVKQILQFSRQSEVKMGALDTAGLVNEVVKLLRATIPLKYDIKLEITKDISPVLADATQIHQVIMNLCTNAYHAMKAKDHGVLSISLDIEETAKEIEGQTHNLAPGKYVRLAVSDTGYGISPEHIDLIFDPYFTTKNPGEGTGLGLSVSLSIIKDHRGCVRVESTPGEGSTFYVYLPAIDAKTTESTSKPIEIKGGRERILFVDDEEIFLELASEMLSNLGYEIICLKDSCEALAGFRAAPERFDLIITDLTMPRLTGVELANKIHDIRPQIPIILRTGFSEKVDAEKLKRIGICRVLNKPVRRVDFAVAIREIIDNLK